MSEYMYSVRFDVIMNDRSIPAFIRALAYDLQQQTYMTPGEFFEHISDHDLDYLAECVEKEAMIQEDERTDESELSDGLKHIFALGSMLCVAEGAELNDERGEQIYKTTAMFIIVERLYRKGLIDIFRNGFSYDNLDAPIAQAKPT